MNETTVYKICRKRFEMYVSFNYSSYELCDTVLKYPLGVMVFPKIKESYLLCFKTLKDVRRFIKDVNSCETLYIFEATTTSKLHNIALLTENPSMIKRFWSTLFGKVDINTVREDEDVMEPPIGTVGVENLTLVKLIEEI